MGEKEYLADQFEKLKTVITAARQNRTPHTSLRIRTIGTDPDASVCIEASVLEKFLKPPASV